MRVFYWPSTSGVIDSRLMGSDTIMCTVIYLPCECGTRARWFYAYVPYSFPYHLLHLFFIKRVTRRNVFRNRKRDREIMEIM